MVLRVLLTCLATSICTASIHADWPQFRGIGGAAKAEQANLPLTWSATENILWKQPLPGAGASSPIVVGNRIYITAYSGYGLDAENPGDKSQLQLHVLALDRATGAIQWKTDHAASPAEQECNKRVADHGYASGTPASDGDAVYASFGASGVFAVDGEGKTLWHADIGSNTAGFGSAASPIVWENLVIVNGSIESNTVYAFDKLTGKESWRISGVNKSWTTPSVVTTADGVDELVVSFQEKLNGYNPRTGELLWTCEGVQDYVVPCVVSDKGICYCLGGRKNQCFAVRSGGRGDVTATHKLWEANLGANVTSPVYHNGYLYWSSDKAIAYCVNAATGEMAYRERLPTSARVYASAVLGGNHLFATTRDRGVVVIEATPTHFKELAQNVIDGDEDMFNATPAIDGNRLLLRTNSQLYCIGEK